MNGDRLPADGPTEFLWSRHANPGSVWTLVATYPALIAGVYRRDRRLLAAALLFVLVNPFLFRPPESDHAWATRVVLGERRWLDRGIRSSPVDAALVAVATPVHLFAVRSAVRRDAVRTVVGTALSLVLMLLFFDRMSQLYAVGPASAGEK